MGKQDANFVERKSHTSAEEIKEEKAFKPEDIIHETQSESSSSTIKTNSSLAGSGTE